jgi:gliding motility-associated-like protein
VSPDQSICPGGSATISANGSGGDGTYNYNWIPGGMTGATQTVSPGITTVYTVTLTDGCTTTPVTDTVKVTINPLPNVSFTADTLSGCEPLCVDFTDKSTISSGVINQWAWTFGDGDSSSLQDPRHCYDSAGVFTVSLKVTSNNGCSASYTAPNLITVFGKPVAKFISSPNPTPIVAPTVQFTDESTDAYGGISTWAWTFGDKTDSVSSKQNPIHTYGDTGTYCAQLIVTNIHGCMDTVTGCEVIEPYFTIFIPNAFSPNGDGLNDVFTAKGIFICTFEMYIFDRWGMQLYYTNDINMGWDGTVNGSGTVEQEDTYIYVINVTDCIEHKKHQYLGKVTLIK